MKKLLVVLMVLAMAPLANAALLVVSEAQPGVEEVTLMESDILVLDIFADATVPQGTFYLGMLLGGEGGGHLDISQAIMDYAGVPSTLSWNPDGDIDAQLGMIAPSVLANLTDTVVPIVDPEGSLVRNILFHCDQVGIDVTIGLFDGATGALLDSIIIHQVPEPITMVLLGLGGLMLRRRK